MWSQPRISIRGLPISQLTVNLLHGSHINPVISAYQQVHGIYNYDANPIALAGVKVVVFEDPYQRKTWATQAGYYVGPAMDWLSNAQMLLAIELKQLELVMLQLVMMSTLFLGTSSHCYELKFRSYAEELNFLLRKPTQFFLECKFFVTLLAIETTKFDYR